MQTNLLAFIANTGWQLFDRFTVRFTSSVRDMGTAGDIVRLDPKPVVQIFSPERTQPYIRVPLKLKDPGPVT